MQPVAGDEPERIDNIETALDFAELFRQFYPRVYTYLCYRVNSAEDVEDLLSTVFEKAYTHRESFDADKGGFSTWLFRIAHNTLANYYRSRERQGKWLAGQDVLEQITTTEAPLETQLIEQESIAHLLQGISQLSERDQEVISLKFAGHLSNRDIGQIMDLKEKTVSVVLLRAMRRLQKEVRSGQDE